MTVRIRMLQGSAPLASFTQNTFTGATLGPDWAIGAWRTTNDGNNRLLYTINTNALRVANDGGGDGQIAFWFIPTVLTGVRNSNQFSQGTIISLSGGAMFGPMVFAAPSASGSYTMSFYSFVPDVPNNRWILWRNLIGTSLNVVTSNVGLAVHNVLPAVGNTARLEARVNGSQIDLIAKVNGATVITTSDANAERPRNGIPGLGGPFCPSGGAANVSWNAFSAGAL